MKIFHLIQKTLILSAFTVGTQVALAEDGRIFSDFTADNSYSQTPSKLEVALGANYIFGLGNDAPDQTGVGLSIGLFALVPKETTDNWQTKFGLEIYGFGTSADVEKNGNSLEEKIYSAQILFNFGGTYSLGKYVEIGAIIGVGTGVSYGETKSDTATSREGNWNYALQFKPQITAHLSETTDVWLALRLAYIGPFYQTELVGYDTVRMLHQSIELGISWRF